MTIDTTHVYTAEHTAKSVAFIGLTDEEERVLILGHDASISSARPSNKSMLEGWHLERLHRDLLSQTNEGLYTQVRPSSSEPPDFIAETAGRTIGIEATQIMDETRRLASGLFQGLQRLVKAKARFDALQGCVLYVAYWEAADGPLPFRVNDTANTEIIEAINQLEVPFDKLAIPTDTGMPDHAPDIGLTRLDSGASLHAAPLVGNHVATPFMMTTGFEMVHATSTSYTVTAIAEHLAETINRKDVPESQLLVITAGGPTRNGIAWPSEEIYAREGLNHLGPVEAKYLTRVILHFWGTGEAWDLLQGPTKLIDGIEERSTRRWNDRLVPHWGTTGRNSLCPCESGRSFKKCHGS